MCLDFFAIELSVDKIMIKPIIFPKIVRIIFCLLRTGNVDESKKVSSATIGIAVGIIVALLIVSVAVVLLICRIRKKKTSKE